MSIPSLYSAGMTKRSYSVLLIRMSTLTILMKV